MVIAYAAAAMSSLTRISCTETGFRDENHLQAKAGTTYLFQVTDDAYDAASTDTASLWIRASAPISNLSPATASSVSVPSTVTGSIAKVDNNWYEPYAGMCGDGFATLLGTRWYEYVATGTTGVRVDLRDSYYDADAVVWASDGSVPTSVLTCPAQQRGDGGATGFYEKTNAYADFAVEPGKTYFIQVGGWNFSVGDYVMKLSTYQLPLLTQMPTPKITGTAQVGSTLTVNPGTWDEGTTLTYQWMRGNGSYIFGAKGTTYTVGAADVGTQITVAVSATKPGYSPARKTSAPTAVVVKGTLSGATPTITGTTKVGYTLTARAGTWAPAPVALSYQWSRNGVAISGATSSTYKLTSSDKGKRITVKVTGTKTGYTTLAKTSAATATIG
ncbi:hypothetical protein QE410_001754 [Microbacterium sp. SORGH_AS 1204]|uniref:hypothetical protein n=1 Tax=Microbacterium sp. SORGH_AS_1204 TaxID=3041785 RepID=UPI002790507C|nr:hypothetical protein [Microbacterium sp. SORGH_AS_1204]MDQ1136955.1 hypothetical protein [Microbacterium sp. SORGH_AS_1204]